MSLPYPTLPYLSYPAHHSVYEDCIHTKGSCARAMASWTHIVENILTIGATYFVEFMPCCGSIVAPGDVRLSTGRRDQGYIEGTQIMHLCTTVNGIQASMLQANGRRAHHSGWIALAPTPFSSSRYRSSCRRGSAVLTSSALPSGCFAVQKVSAEVAARGQTVESRLSGPICSVQSSCWPVGGQS